MLSYIYGSKLVAYGCLSLGISVAVGRRIGLNDTMNICTTTMEKCFCKTHNALYRSFVLFEFDRRDWETTSLVLVKCNSV